MPHSGTSGTPGSSEVPAVGLTRRELRALREAGSPDSDASAPQDEAVTDVDAPAVEVPAVDVPAVQLSVVTAQTVVAPIPRATAATRGPDVASIVARARRHTAKPAPTATRPAPRASHGRSPLRIAVTLLAIPAMFLTAGLPAYAFSPDSAADGHSASASHVLATTGAQGVTVAAGAAAVTVARDGFTATTKEELAAKEALAKRALASQKASENARASAAAFAVYGVRAEGDDYPWYSEATDAQGGGLSPLSYYYRECVDFVAYRLNRDAGSTSAPWKWTWNNLTPGGGNASSWSSAWSKHGWATSHTPVVGAVAWFSYNHVAYVQSIGSDGSVVLEEYNWMGSHNYHTRTVAASEVDLFLYPPT